MIRQAKLYLVMPAAAVSAPAKAARHIKDRLPVGDSRAIVSKRARVPTNAKKIIIRRIVERPANVKRQNSSVSRKTRVADHATDWSMSRLANLKSIQAVTANKSWLNKAIHKSGR